MYIPITVYNVCDVDAENQEAIAISVTLGSCIFSRRKGSHTQFCFVLLKIFFYILTE